jgi:outer membrane protein assembly factor BamB
VLTCCLSAAAAETTVWTSLRGDAANAASCRWESAEPAGAIREWSFRGRPGRRYQPGVAVWASPALAVVAGRPMAFIGGFDQTMHALDLLAKEERWAKITNGAIAESPAVGLLDGRQVVFWGSADRTVYAYWADSRGESGGARLWSRELVPATSTMGEAQLSAPLLHGGVLYIAGFVYDRAMARSQQQGWLFALDARTGAELWRHPAAPGALGSPTGAELDGRFTVFLAARRGLLQALDVSGAAPRVLWRYQMPHEVLGSPAVDADPAGPRVFLGSKFGNLIALEARTGRELWKRMAGNWIDNSACVGEVAGVRAVFAGSHDYKVYAFRSADGAVLWKRGLGGEIYSAPAYFQTPQGPELAVAALDNHLYVLDAATGRVETSYFTGQPLWDKVAKGEVLWGSPAALEAGAQTAIVHGSFNGEVYVLPLRGECELRAKVQSAATLWWGLGLTAAVFLGLVLPAVLLWRPRAPARH